MFASNNQISMRQLYRLFVFDLIGVSTLVLPPKLANFSESDGICVILIGTVMASIYLWYLGKVVIGMKTDFCSYMEQSLQGWLKKLLLVFLGLHMLWVAGYCAYIFADVMKTGLLPEESYTLLLVIILFVACYAVSGGIESRARIYEILFWILAVGLLIMFAIAAHDIQWDYVGPFLQSSAEGAGKGSILVFLCFMPLTAVLFFPSYIEKGKEKKMIGTVLAALWSAALILAVLYLILLGTFGNGALKTMQYPAVTLMNSIHMRSSYLKRLDAFMLGIWFFTLFAVVNLFMFYGNNLLHRLSVPGTDRQGKMGDSGQADRKKRTEWICLIASALLIFFAAELFYYRDWTGFFLNYLCYLGMPLLVLLPGLVLVIGKARGK